ncbi:aconitate hydratase AcnA [Olsenella massiliensis]|uniref:aconitate hydratase AcnA n=1 Tax=Olsenella massiliensis TaxID=1622075 RepID=UPI0009E85EE2|nr:aconitate hydratase AcnA [Olsenella massiliensis]
MPSIVESLSAETFSTAVIDARRPKTLEAGGVRRRYVDVSAIPGADRLPRALVILLENCVRRARTDDDAVRFARRVVEAGLAGSQGEEIEFMPARVLFQDFTGVPVFVDVAAMRDAMVARGGDPSRVNPRIPCTLVVDHSVVADCAGEPDAAERNEALEAERNAERFAFLKWASTAFQNVDIVPPAGGICHQLNIERFCTVVGTDALAAGELACFDTLVGTDSHTPTANGLGVLGWGVGGIEAEAAALGQPISLLVPPVVELRLVGALGDGVSGMDLALTVAKLLRDAKVVGALVEVTGEGVGALTPTQRACVANMTPEYGCTTTLFPVDEAALDYLRLTGRPAGDVDFAKAYLRAEGVFGTRRGRRYARTLKLDLARVTTSLAGPSRPHALVTPAGLRERFRRAAEEHGNGDLTARFDVTVGGTTHSLGHGTLALAAITSCTTATDPAMMVAAGLLARRAVRRGLSPKPWVKRIFAPGSRATELTLARAGLTEPLFRLGFFTCGFGCMSCIGNSGEIDAGLKAQASRMELTSVLSGNRNFDGRISPDVAQNYLCQPALVVAYALAGTLDIDLSREPVGIASDGRPVMLRELMPTSEELSRVLSEVLSPDLYREGTRGLFEGSEAWRRIKVPEGSTFAWDEASTYIRRAPYFELARPADVVTIEGARILALLGDFVTTDHISPAGTIVKDAPAAAYLREHGVAERDFNSYGSRRGNHDVMVRGTFANVRLENALADGRRGWWTTDQLDGRVKPIFDAAEHYRSRGVASVVVAGRMYGSGSSRDWAAKGPLLLGVRAVIAESFERIHRSNLVQMGIVPLEFTDGQSASSLGLRGDELIDVGPIDLSRPTGAPARCRVVARAGDGRATAFECRVRIDTPMEGRFVARGGILPYVLDQMT